jgi:hypothetical protein
LLVVAKAALVAEYLAAIFANVAIVEPVVPSPTTLVQPTSALRDFIRAHGLQPVDSIG